jgi:hypothetical protein
MKTTKEIATEIRKQLKAAGYNARAVSVRTRHLGVDSAITVAVRRADVRLVVVREIADGFERIHCDRATGEVLLGGNLYVDVTYAEETVRPFQVGVEIQIEGECAEPGVVAEIEGFHVWRCTAERDYLWADHPEWDRPIKCWGVEHLAKQLTYYALGGCLPR